MTRDLLEFMDELTGPLLVGNQEGFFSDCLTPDLPHGSLLGKCKWDYGFMRQHLVDARGLFADFTPTREAPLPVELCFAPERHSSVTVKTLVYVCSAHKFEELRACRAQDCYFDIVRFHAFDGMHPAAAFNVVQAVTTAHGNSIERDTIHLLEDWASSAELCAHFGAGIESSMLLSESLVFRVLGVLEAHSRGREPEATLLRHELCLTLVCATPGGSGMPVLGARRVLQSLCEQQVKTFDARSRLLEGLEMLGLMLARNGCWHQALVYLGIVHELHCNPGKAEHAPPPLASALRLFRLEVMRESLLGAAVGHPKLRTQLLDKELGMLGVTSSFMRQLIFEFADVADVHRMPAEFADAQLTSAHADDFSPAAATHMRKACKDLRAALAPRETKVALVHESLDEVLVENDETALRGAGLERWIFKKVYHLAATEKPAGSSMHTAVASCMLSCLRMVRAALLPFEHFQADNGAKDPSTEAAVFEAQLDGMFQGDKIAWDSAHAAAVLALCEGTLGAAVHALYARFSWNLVLMRVETKRLASCAHAHVIKGTNRLREQSDETYVHILQAYKYHKRLVGASLNRLVCIKVCNVSMISVLGQMVLAPGIHPSEQLRLQMSKKFLAAFFVDVCQDALVYEQICFTLRACLMHYVNVGSFSHVARIMQQIQHVFVADFRSMDPHVVKLENSGCVMEWLVVGAVPLILVCRSMLESMVDPGPYVHFTGRWANFQRGDIAFMEQDGTIVDAACSVASKASRVQGGHPMVHAVAQRVKSGHDSIVWENTAAACKYAFRRPLELSVRLNVRVGELRFHFDVVAGLPFLHALQLEVWRQLAKTRNPAAHAGWASVVQEHVFFYRGYMQLFNGLTPLMCLGCPLVLRDGQHLDVVAVQRAQLGERRLRRQISNAQGCALQLTDKVLWQWLRNDMPGISENPEFVYRLGKAVARKELPASLLASRGVQLFLARLHCADVEACAFADTMARVLSAQRRPAFYCLRACMERFVGLAARGLLNDASRWLARVRGLWVQYTPTHTGARGSPRLGSFDALFLQLYFVLHLLPVAEFVLRPGTVADVGGDERLMLVRQAVDYLEACKPMLHAVWCSPKQRCLWHLCMAMGALCLGTKTKRVMPFVRKAEAIVRECTTEASPDDLILDKRVLAGWQASHLHTLTLQSVSDMLLAMHSPLPARVATEPPATAATTSAGASASPATEPPAPVIAEPPAQVITEPPATSATTIAGASASPATEQPAQAIAEPPARVVSERQAFAQVALQKQTAPSNNAAQIQAHDDDTEDALLCIICMENQVCVCLCMLSLTSYAPFSTLTSDRCWQRTHVLLPCKHFFFCDQCVGCLSQCPLCNEKIQDTMRIFM